MQEERKRLVQVYGISAVIILLLAAGLIWWWMASSQPTQTAKSAEPTLPTAPQEAQIEITSTGFSPAELNISPGTQVVWINKTSSDQHVTAAEAAQIPGLDSQAIAAGQGYVFTFQNSGDFTFENANNPLQHGVIHVN